MWLKKKQIKREQVQARVAHVTRASFVLCCLNLVFLCELVLWHIYLKTPNQYIYYAYWYKFKILRIFVLFNIQIVSLLCFVFTVISIAQHSEPLWVKVLFTLLMGIFCLLICFFQVNLVSLETMQTLVKNRNFQSVTLDENTNSLLYINYNLTL